MEKKKIETDPVLVLDSVTSLRSKSYSFSYQRREAYDNPMIQKHNKKEYKKPPNVKITRILCSCP